MSSLTPYEDKIQGLGNLGYTQSNWKVQSQFLWKWWGRFIEKSPITQLPNLSWPVIQICVSTTEKPVEFIRDLGLFNPISNLPKD